MAEDKKKAVKKKMSKKKTAKKVVRKKVVKKAVSKKVTKKAEKRKATKKILRKKAAQKKPIKLKADSPELDSFASHAAENVEAIEAAAVSLEASPAASNPEKTDSSNSTASDKSTTTKAEKTTVAKKEDISTKVTVASTAKSKSAYKKPVPATKPPTRAVSASDNESFTSKLVIAGLLFVGVGVYLLTIFNDDSRSLPTAQSTVINKKADTQTTQKPVQETKPELSQVLDNIAESSDTTPATAVKEESGIEFKLDKTTLTTSEPAKQTEQGSQLTIDKEKSLEQTLNEEALKQPIAKIGSDQTVEAQETAHFPPPPTPDFLQKTAIRPLPEKQMELIKDLFAPELK